MGDGADRCSIAHRCGGGAHEPDSAVDLDRTGWVGNHRRRARGDAVAAAAAGDCHPVHRQAGGRDVGRRQAAGGIVPGQASRGVEAAAGVVLDLTRIAAGNSVTAGKRVIPTVRGAVELAEGDGDVLRACFVSAGIT